MPLRASSSGSTARPAPASAKCATDTLSSPGARTVAPCFARSPRLPRQLLARVHAPARVDDLAADQVLGRRVGGTHGDVSLAIAHVEFLVADEDLEPYLRIAFVEVVEVARQETVRDVVRRGD